MRTRPVSANMVDNNNDDLSRRMETQEQTSRAQREALDNIQQMLAQLLTNRNTNDTGSNHNDEKQNNNERPKTISQRKAPRPTPRLLRASKLRLHPWPRQMN